MRLKVSKAGNLVFKGFASQTKYEGSLKVEEAYSEFRLSAFQEPKVTAAKDNGEKF